MRALRGSDGPRGGGVGLSKWLVGGGGRAEKGLRVRRGSGGRGIALLILSIPPRKLQER